MNLSHRNSKGSHKTSGTQVSFVFACVPANAEVKHKFQVPTVNFLTVQSPLVTLRTIKFNIKKFMF